MPLDTRQPGCLPPGASPRAFNDNIAVPGSTNPGIPITELKGAYGAEHHASYLHPSFQALLPSHDQRLPEQQFSCFDRLCGFGAAPHAAVKSPEKRLLIFDQSGNQTRLLRCAFPLQYPSAMAAEPTKLPDLRDLEKGIRKEHFGPEKISLHEEFDENHLSGEESEMHEDTEEINALLYSDDDDGDDDEDGDDDCNSDDEVMSTGHSPFPLKEICNKTELEEIDSSGGPHKRQKLLDGGYNNKSSLLDSESSIKLQGLLEGEKPPESNNSSKQEMGSGLSDEQSRKDKIRTALKILENIVPGAKGKEALLLLDEAIDYLKLLKQNAKSFGLSYC